MHKIKSNQFPLETRQHRMAGLHDVYQLRYGTKVMLYFGFDCIEEYNMALELNEGTPILIDFSKRYNPADFDRLTNPMPKIVFTDLKYPYIPREGYELVTIKNVGKMLQGILDYCQADHMKKPDWQLGCNFMADVTKWLHDDAGRSYAIYCNPDKISWDLIEVNTCEDGGGLYLGILVKS